jgi:hypothetical protein
MRQQKANDIRVATNLENHHANSGRAILWRSAELRAGEIAFHPTQDCRTGAMRALAESPMLGTLRPSKASKVVSIS